MQQVTRSEWQVKDSVNNNKTGEVALSRDLRLIDVTMIGIGGMIGAGIFVLTGIAAGQAGPALVLAFLLNGVVTSLTAMAYAELGSALPEAGGGFLWVKESLGGAQGFLAGWMSWFAHAVAGTLYAMGFGRFAAELWTLAGIPTMGLSQNQITLILMTLIVILFVIVNYRGASETGKVGNIITGGKVVILGIFVLAGVIAMFRIPEWPTRFTENFLPNGLGGVFVAMGLTFIAFEGYEIIAQSGEEVIDPKRNIPRAIFLSVGIAVVIYVLVAIVTLGAITPPEGVPIYQYLDQKKEIAVVEAAGQFLPFGNIILLISGLASTMSALNATTYSSSRVSFAMGREHNLPAVFSKVHTVRHTPYMAIMITGVLMILMGWLLPIEDVGAGSSLMFLLLFVQVNVSVMLLRQRRPDLDRGYKIPWFPLVPVLAIIFQAALALYLFTYSPQAWIVSLAWIITGLLLYYTIFSKIEALERPSEILLEEVLVSRKYSVLLPVVNPAQARILGHIGSVIAGDHDGEVFALYVVRVPQQLTLGDGRLFLREGRPPLEAVIEQAKERDVPVHTMIRLGRDVAEAVSITAMENASDLIVLGWPGYTNTAGRLFGSVIDPIVDNPTTDIALVRYRKHRTLKSVLVPVAGGRNSRLITSLAITMARQEEAGPARVTLLHIVPPGASEAARVRGMQYIDQALAGNTYEYVDKVVVEHSDIVECVLQAAEGHDLILVGATDEPLFRNLLVGNVAERIARNAKVTTIMVKRRSGPIKSMLRQTVLAPSTRSLSEGSAGDNA
jgi:basic amino acid/polyamine antiporter, APA family